MIFALELNFVRKKHPSPCQFEIVKSCTNHGSSHAYLCTRGEEPGSEAPDSSEDNIVSTAPGRNAKCPQRSPDPATGLYRHRRVVTKPVN
jgi:hypothetical protein